MKEERKEGVYVPRRMRTEEMMIERRGPEVCRAQRVKGDETRNAKRKAVLSQLITVEEVA